MLLFYFQSPPKPLIKQRRELASVVKFALHPLNTMFWDDWTTFIMPAKPSIKADAWKKCSGGYPGFYNSELYTDSKQVTAVYEVAVIPPNTKKQYPVYFNIKSLWDNFDTPFVKKEVERVIKSKGSVSIRRGVLKKPSDTAFQKVVEFMAGSFDYPWQGTII